MENQQGPFCKAQEYKARILGIYTAVFEMDNLQGPTI